MANKQPTFKYDDWRERKQQAYDKDNIFIERAGKKINLFQLIQENKDETDLYSCLEKYGCIDKLGIDPNAVYADFTEIQKERSIFDQQLKAQKLWESLPLDVRQQFNHNIKDFVNNGEKWLQQEIEKQQPKVEIQPEQNEPKGE